MQAWKKTKKKTKKMPEIYKHIMMVCGRIILKSWVVRGWVDNNKKNNKNNKEQQRNAKDNKKRRNQKRIVDNSKRSVISSFWLFNSTIFIKELENN